MQSKLFSEFVKPQRAIPHAKGLIQKDETFKVFVTTNIRNWLIFNLQHLSVPS